MAWERGWHWGKWDWRPRWPLPHPRCAQFPISISRPCGGRGRRRARRLSSHRFAMGLRPREVNGLTQGHIEVGGQAGVSAPKAGLQCPFPALPPQSATQSLPAQSGANWSGGAGPLIYKRSEQACRSRASGGGLIFSVCVCLCYGSWEHCLQRHLDLLNLLPLHSGGIRSVWV